MDRGGGEALLGGEQHVVPRAGQVLGQRQVAIGAQAKGEGRAPPHHPEAGGQVADGLAQIAGQQAEHPAERQAIDIDRADPGRVGIEVPQLGQAGARAGHLGGADGDQGARLAGRRGIQAAGAQRLPPEGHHLLPVPQQRVGASQPVGDQGGQRLAARVVPRLRQRLAEPPLGLGELAGGERHRAQHAAAQRGWRRPPRPPRAGPGPGPPRPASGAAPRSAAAVPGRPGPGRCRRPTAGGWRRARGGRAPPPGRPAAPARRPGPHPAGPGRPPGAPRTPTR